MGSFVDWWCHLIGIHDIYSIQIATGIVGGGSAILIALIIWSIVGVVIQLLIRSTDNNI